MRILKEKVQLGTCVPGDQIPGEQELCALYRVSRTVVRQALRELELEGVINRRKGKGTFIFFAKNHRRAGAKTDRCLPGYAGMRPQAGYESSAPKYDTRERKGGSLSQYRPGKRGDRYPALAIYQ